MYTKVVGILEGANLFNTLKLLRYTNAQEISLLEFLLDIGCRDDKLLTLSLVYDNPDINLISLQNLKFETDYLDASYFIQGYITNLDNELEDIRYRTYNLVIINNYLIVLRLLDAALNERDELNTDLRKRQNIVDIYDTGIRLCPEYLTLLNIGKYILNI